MTRLLQRPSLLAALLLASACSNTPALTLSASPATAPGDLATPIVITALVTRAGSPVDGVPVHFTTDDGFLSSGSGCSGTGTLDVDSAQGKASATLYPPRRGRGKINVTASSAVTGVAVSDKTAITLTPAGSLASSLLFFCAAQNVGALVPNRLEPIHVGCTAKALDASGKEIKNASIELMAEAGSLSWQLDPTSCAQTLVYSVDPGAPPPVDVAPLGPDGNPRVDCPAPCIADPSQCDAEPCWVDGSITRNPRDGVVTLVAAVPGAKSPDDVGEPFVDADDDGQRSPTEPFIDTNGNGKYDRPDNSSKEHMLWKSFRIIWSGPVDVSATPHGTSIVATSSGKLANGTVHVWDQNYNAVAADGTAHADTLSMAGDVCTNQHQLTLPTTPILLRQSSGPGSQPGIAFDPSTYAILAKGASSSYRIGTDYAFSASIDATPEQCNVHAQLNRSFDPGAPGFSPQSSLNSEIVSGKIAWQ